MYVIVKPAIRTKRRDLLSSGVLLLHDNARPHTAIHTLQTLVKLGFTVLEHPAYSPDVAPSDYHLFGPLKDALRGRQFTSYGMKKAVHEWLAAQPKTFFSEGIQKLLERWNKRIAKHGDYTEKLYNCKVSAVVEINYENCVRILFDLPKYNEFYSCGMHHLPVWIASHPTRQQCSKSLTQEPQISRSHSHHCQSITMPT